MSYIINYITIWWYINYILSHFYIKFVNVQHIEGDDCITCWLETLLLNYNFFQKYYFVPKTFTEIIFINILVKKIHLKL